MQNQTARNATLSDLATILQYQQGRKVDMVVPAVKMWSDSGVIVVEGTDPIITDTGVTTIDGRYRPTSVFDEGVSAKLDIPLAYLRRLRNDRPDLYDANVNGFLYGNPAAGEQVGPDSRSFLLRGFRGDGIGGEGVARALLSDRYAKMDHLDALTAALDGVQAAGVAVDVYSADLTDRRMVVRVKSEEVAAVAPRLLEGYRSPWNGALGSDNPTVFAGFEISNSETGGGAFTITPRLVVQICTNGMKVTRDAMAARHVGGKLEDGMIEWSSETQQKNLELISSRTADAVRTFLNVEYLEKTIARMDEKAGREVTSVDEVTQLATDLKFTQAHIDGVLGHFIKGGQMTLGGVVNAVTAYAQTVEDGDDAYQLESKATALLGV